MTRITHTQIEITQNPMLKAPIVVPQWEAHVVLALWGEDAQITGTTVINREIPEANDEFTRLANKYGPRDEDIPFVARVYGSFGPGLRALENEFQASTAGSPVKSQAAQVTEVRPDVIAPEVLAGFNGSQAPTAPEDVQANAPLKSTQVVSEAVPLTLEEGADAVVGGLTDEQIDAIDNVPALDGNTIDGAPMDEYMNDISDLTGEGEDPQVA